MPGRLKRLGPGDPAPLFTLPDQRGDPVSLADFRGAKVVVLYFYPKDETPGCTREACAFRDAYESFSRAGAVVIGVSDDSVERHQAFAGRHALPFLLLADEQGEVRKAYGVRRRLGLLPGRVTFVIDEAGAIRFSFSAQFGFARHVDEALRVVQELAR